MARKSEFVNTLIARHGSAELARRHLGQIRRDNPDSDVEIISRRNANGHFSRRGTVFVFRITQTEKLIDSLAEFFNAYDEAEDFEQEEYASSADYGDEE